MFELREREKEREMRRARENLFYRERERDERKKRNLVQSMFGNERRVVQR